MKLLKILLVCLMFAVIGTPSQATEENENLLELSAEFMVWSRYMGCQGSVWSQRPTAITDITVALRKTPLQGLYANFEMYTALDKTAFTGQNYSNEIDWTLGFAREIKGIQTNFGISYFDVIPLFKTEGYAWVPFAEIGKEFKPEKTHRITPYVRIEGRILRENRIPQNGIFAIWGIKHSWQITESLALKQKINLLYDSGTFGLQESLHGQYRMEAQYALTKHFFLKPFGLYFSAPLTKINDGRKPTAIFASGLGHTF